MSIVCLSRSPLIPLGSTSHLNVASFSSQWVLNSLIQPRIRNLIQWKKSRIEIGHSSTTLILEDVAVSLTQPFELKHPISRIEVSINPRESFEKRKLSLNQMLIHGLELLIKTPSTIPSPRGHLSKRQTPPSVQAPLSLDTLLDQLNSWVEISSAALPIRFEKSSIHYFDSETAGLTLAPKEVQIHFQPQTLTPPFTMSSTRIELTSTIEAPQISKHPVSLETRIEQRTDHIDLSTHVQLKSFNFDSLRALLSPYLKSWISSAQAQSLNLTLHTRHTQRTTQPITLQGSLSGLTLKIKDSQLQFNDLKADLNLILIGADPQVSGFIRLKNHLPIRSKELQKALTGINVQKAQLSFSQSSLTQINLEFLAQNTPYQFTYESLPQIHPPSTLNAPSGSTERFTLQELNSKDSTDFLQILDQTHPSEVHHIQIQGQLKHLSLNSIQSVTELTQALFIDSQVNALPKFLLSGDLDLGTFSLGSWDFRKLHLNFREHSQQSLITLESSDTEGRVTLPMMFLQERTQPIELFFHRIRLHDRSELSPHSNSSLDSSSSVDPRSLPAVNFYCKDLRLGEARLGSLHVELTPTRDGLQAKEIDLDSGYLRLWTDQAQWVQTANGPEVTLIGEMNLWNLKKISQDLKISSHLGKSKGQILFSLSWKNHLFPLWEKLQGRISFHLTDGFFSSQSNVLEALIKLISLDILGLQRNTHSFSNLDGTLIFDSGQIEVQSTKLKLKAATFHFQGMISLIERTFNLQLEVTPKLSQTLLGAPLVPILWTMQKLNLKKSWFDRLLSHIYTLQGELHPDRLEVEEFRLNLKKLGRLEKKK